MNQRVIDEARAHWVADNRPLELGQVLYDNLAVEQRPEWAASLLKLVYSRINSLPDIDMLLEIAPVRERWHEALKVFNNLRNFTLRSDNRLYNSVLSMARKTAKVIYNASGRTSPFDHKTGWELVVDLHEIVNRVNDEAFTKEVWETLIAPYK
jgi:hypothetical protein